MVSGIRPGLIWAWLQASISISNRRASPLPIILRCLEWVGDMIPPPKTFLFTTARQCEHPSRCPRSAIQTSLSTTCQRVGSTVRSVQFVPMTISP